MSDDGDSNHRAAPTVGLASDRRQAGGFDVHHYPELTGSPEVLVKRQANVNENRSDAKDRRVDGDRYPVRLYLLPTRR